MKRTFNLLQRYVASALALHAQGTLGYVGIAKETTYGTAVAATDYFEIMSENLTESIDRFPTRNAFGGFYEPDDYAGARRVAGDIVMFGHPVSIGHLLKAAMNTVSGAAVVSGFLHTTKFITVKSEFTSGADIFPSQPYTLEVHRDVTSSHQYTGAVCNRLQLSLSPNQDLRVTAGFIAKAGGLIAKTTPTFPGSPTDPFTFETASLSIGGTATARWESFNLTVNNNLDGILALNASQNIARIRRRGPQEVRISGVLDFQDVTEYLDFKNQTERQLQLTLTRANSFSMKIDAPRFVYTTFPTGIPGRDRLTVGVDGICRYSVSSGLAIDMQLTTTKSNY
jgi:hypothetical protein